MADTTTIHTETVAEALTAMLQSLADESTGGAR